MKISHWDRELNKGTQDGFIDQINRKYFCYIIDSKGLMNIQAPFEAIQIT